MPERVHVTVLVLRNSFEVIPRVLAGSVACLEPPDLRTVGSGLAGDVFQMCEEQARRSDRVVPDGLSHHQREVRLANDSYLSREVQDPVVVRDESIPRPLVMVKREKDFPVLNLRS